MKNILQLTFSCLLLGSCPPLGADDLTTEEAQRAVEHSNFIHRDEVGTERKFIRRQL